MRENFMTLENIKTEFLDGKISSLKVTRLISKLKDQLDEIYPIELSIIGKMYMYINDLVIDDVMCEKSNKVKSFASINQGFRKFCGTTKTCSCNLTEMKNNWESKDDVEIQVINAKRKKTVQEKYGVDSVSQLDESKIKAEKTCLIRYGTKSPTQNPDILQKSSMTCLTNNGVRWPQQNADILAKTNSVFMNKYGVTRPAKNLMIQNKMKITMISRYGVENLMYDSSFAKKVNMSWKNTKYDEMISSSNRNSITPLFNKDEYCQCTTNDLLLWKCNHCSSEFYSTFRLSTNKSCPICNPKTMTWGEILISKWLDELNIDYEYGTYSIISPQQLDFYIPKLNLAIEFNGLYWHSELMGRKKTYHIDKFKKCESKNIKLIQIFEQDLIKNESLIKSRLLSSLKKSETKIYARNLQVVEITSSDAKQFYNNTHIQGSLSSKYNYALVKDDIIYSVMSFSKTRFSSKLAEYELTRFSSLLNHNVIGAASKLFSHFIKLNNVKSVVSYADLRWGRGQVYEKMNFVFSHYSQPNYWYFKSINDIHSRIKFQKHKLPAELHHLGSEWDIMKHLGYNRFWDAGNAVWVWKINN